MLHFQTTERLSLPNGFGKPELEAIAFTRCGDHLEAFRDVNCDDQLRARIQLHVQQTVLPLRRAIGGLAESLPLPSEPSPSLLRKLQNAAFHE